MSDFNYTIRLAQSDLDDLKARMASALVAAPRRAPKRGFVCVGRVPYKRSKYRASSLGEVDRIVHREVF